MNDGQQSALAYAADRIGDRWTLLLIDALQSAPLRFGELLSAVQGIASNVLTQRLRKLEREGIVVSRPYSTRPVRLVYELSALGRELAGVLILLRHWATAGQGAEALRHSSCGTPMEARWFCPTCARSVLEGEEPGLQTI